MIKNYLFVMVITCSMVLAEIFFVLPTASSYAVSKRGADLLEVCPRCLDFSRVTWAHAVNSKNLLHRYLYDSNAVMLEADVSTGRLLSDPEWLNKTPIMAHPPDVTSDLSLQQFMDYMIDFNKNKNKKGAKLDFKTIEAFEDGLDKILSNKTQQINFPIWINADILRGPGGEDKIPVDAQRFLVLSKQYFPEVTLSVGWKTTYSKDESVFYAKDHMNEMIQTLKKYNITQPITFPIRAAYVGRSMKEILYLLDSVPGSTITVWTSKADIVDLECLYELQKKAGFHRVFADLPEAQMKMLKILSF